MVPNNRLIVSLVFRNWISGSLYHSSIIWSNSFLYYFVLGAGTGCCFFVLGAGIGLYGGIGLFSKYCINSCTLLLGSCCCLLLGVGIWRASSLTRTKFLSSLSVSPDNYLHISWLRLLILLLYIIFFLVETSNRAIICFLLVGLSHNFIAITPHRATYIRRHFFKHFAFTEFPILAPQFQVGRGIRWPVTHLFFYLKDVFFCDDDFTVLCSHHSANNAWSERLIHEPKLKLNVPKLSLQAAPFWFPVCCFPAGSSSKWRTVPFLIVYL